MRQYEATTYYGANGGTPFRTIDGIHKNPLPRKPLNGNTNFTPRLSEKPRKEPFHVGWMSNKICLVYGHARPILKATLGPAMPSETKFNI